MQSLFNRAKHPRVQVPVEYAISQREINVLTLHSDSYHHLSLIVGYIDRSRKYTAYAESLKTVSIEYLQRSYFREELLHQVKKYQEALNSLNDYERLQHSQDISLDPYQINKFNERWGY